MHDQTFCYFLTPGYKPVGQFVLPTFKAKTLKKKGNKKKKKKQSSKTRGFNHLNSPLSQKKKKKKRYDDRWEYLISHDDELKLLCKKDPLPDIAIPSLGRRGKG